MCEGLESGPSRRAPRNLLTCTLVTLRPESVSKKARGGVCISGGEDTQSAGTRRAARVRPAAPCRGVLYWGLVACT